MNSRIKSTSARQWLAVACGLWLVGASLWAQESNEAPAAAAAPAAPAAPSAVEVPDPAREVEAVVAEAVSNATAEVKSIKTSRRTPRDSDNPKVIIGNSGEVRVGETNDAFVVIGGNGVVRGRVLDAAVVVGGNLEISGEVDDAAVAVLGNITVRSNAVVKGDAVSVGGKLTIEDGGEVRGEKQSVDFGVMGLPHFERLAEWINQCVLKMRPLAPQVGWVWIVAGVFFFFYLLVAVVLQKPVQTCVNEITRRPATTFLTGLLTKLVAPIVCLILAATGIGLIVVPFLIAALFFGAIIGKVALLEYIGDSLRRAVGGNEPLKPVIALCAGTLLIVICYNIPFLGLLVFALTSVWGLGVAVTAALGSLKREAPQKTTPPPAATPPVGQPGFLAPMPVAMAAAPVAQAPDASASLAADVPEAGAAASTANFVPPPQAAAPVAPLAAMPTGIPEALAYPRAGFWERMGAAFLDLIIVGILSGLAGGFLHRVVPAYGLLVALAYFAGMWAWKGTTVGGVVLSLKVVRLDAGPVTFPVALVRGLGAALSAVVLFLGFLWIAWDEDKQGWHDRIAGTVVVRLPRGTPLVCL